MRIEIVDDNPALLEAWQGTYVKDADEVIAYLYFSCPKCNGIIGVRFDGKYYPGAGPKWEFNRNFECPTIEPSYWLLAWLH